MTTINFFRTLGLCLVLLLLAGHAQAQDFGLNISAGVKKKIVSGLSAKIEGELRTQDKSSELERLAIAAELSYSPIKYFGIDAGYTFIDKFKPEHWTDSGNRIPDYWSPRHRAYASVTGTLVIGDFELALRERYQFTHKTQVSVHKYDANGTQKTKDKVVKASNSHTWRSRLKAEYNFTQIGLTPYISAELYNSLTESFALDKVETTVGVDYKLFKKHTFSLFYRYAAAIEGSSDEPDHQLGIGYQFKF